MSELHLTEIVTPAKAAVRKSKTDVMYGPFPESKDEDGLDGHVSGLLMPERFGLPAWGEHSGVRWDHSDGLWANDDASIEPRCSQAMNEVLARHSIAPLCGL